MKRLFQMGATAGTLSLLLLAPIARSESTQAEPVLQVQENCAAAQSCLPLLAQVTPPMDPAVAPLPVLQILTPAPSQVLDQPAATVTLQFQVGDATTPPPEIELRVNGTPIDPKLVGRVESDSSTNLVRQTWYGVPLGQGDNLLSARIKGHPETETTVRVQVRGKVTQLQISPVESRIPADGRSTATLQGQLLDQNGNRANWDAIVTLQSNAGDFVGEDLNKDQPGFQVEAKQGQFQAKLRSNLTAQMVQIRATSNNLEAFTQLQFETNLRPSLVSGVIDLRLGSRGTDFYGSLKDFLPADGNNGTQLDLRTAVFATGKVGDWLFTGSFNNTRPLNQTCDGNRLFRDVQACEQNYPVYGDSSTVSVTSPSIDSLYLRLEQSSGIPNASPNFFMWGDYNTEEFATRAQQFTAFTRQLHGFKGNYNFGDLQVTALYANNVQGFQRDTIAPDGTSGYYFLSRRLVLAGSENVFLELEELNRPGTVIQRLALQRGPDYEIDYDRGTLLFRRPILRTEVDDRGQTLVRRIVVTYQFDSPGSNNAIYAGRVRYYFSRTFNQESWLGATYWRENQGDRSFELVGADALITLGPASQLILEYAQSRNDLDSTGPVTGSAVRAELNTQLNPNLQLQMYYRSTDTGFANNATTSFVPGQTRYGAQVNAVLSPSTTVKLQVDREENFGIAPQPLNTLEAFLAPRTTAVPGSRVDNSLTTYSIGLQQKIGLADLSLELFHRDRQDRIALLNTSSDQLRTRLTVPLIENLTLIAQNETTLSGQSDPVYGDRTLLGVDWTITQGLNLRVAQQFFGSGPLAGNSLTSMDLTGSYSLGSDTTLTGRYSILGGANGTTMQGMVGLNHRWILAPGLRLNLAYERVFGDFPIATGTGTQFLQPFAVGQSAATLALQPGESYSVGLEYNDTPNFQASARYEFRSSPSGSNTVISAAAAGKLSPAVTVLFRYQQANASNQLLQGLGDTSSLKIGLAYRDPQNDSFNALLRYEYRKNPSVIPNTILLGSGTGSEDQTLALEAIYAPDWQWEFYGKFAVRSSTTYLARDLVGTSSISLAQLRATYRLGYNMDLVGEGRWINQPSTGYSETGFSIEAGYYLTPNLRAAIGYSSGSIVAGDLAGNRSAGGFYAGLTVKLNELFDGFGLQKPLPPAPQVATAPPPVPIIQAAASPPLRLDLAQNLGFADKQANLSPQDMEVLDQIAVILQQYPAVAVEIQAYLPSLLVGSTAPDLETQRVITARGYLLGKGISAQQVIIRSLGQQASGSQNQYFSLVLTGPSETFGFMAAQLENGETASPALNTLRQIVPVQTQATSPTASPPAGLALAVDTNGSVSEQPALNQVISLLKANPNQTIELQGYGIGNPDAALDRLLVARTYLMDQGIEADRILIRTPEVTQLQAQDPNRVDLILSQTPTPTVTAQADRATNLRLALALNLLLGRDTTTVQAMLRTLGINPPEIQGALVDPVLLEKLQKDIR
ncbi:hypothetical protein BST81_15380 [Leptolyngbya sp. 'hensonii']|uniref:hypothetical protein n=1 Tax=Leptolyngbya sp. 'hensonii' TaxID=1922337 RepID=UPI00094FFDC3|nr:hypothetical protein [Leptolyngbya sp. 'hensonii']OLP17699.1 hypothetical protein BST81_15380 [Leptolyngbya sp. 'hensonii']